MTTENGKCTGAIADKKDKRDYKWSDIAMYPAPFDWNAGYDVEKVFNITLKTKNQGASYSCGGQAFSYYAEVLSTVFDKHYDPKSARFIYSQVYVPEGGSGGRECANILIKQGMADETVLSSYDGDNYATEEFMRFKDDINDNVRLNASKNKALTYAQVNKDFETIAQAIRDNHGCVIGVTGSNNGTWLTPYPSSKVVGSTWNHWMYAGKVKILDGIRYIGVKNSWGAVGEQGWQWLREDQTLFSIWTMVYNDIPPTDFKHNFMENLWQGESNKEVTALQIALQLDGCFPKGVSPTGFYGNITAQAVSKFQYKYEVGNALIRFFNGGRLVGSMTREILNKIFNH